jgi:hypothetical protein
MEVDDISDFVDQLVADGRIPAADRITINGRSAFREVAACRDPEGVEPRFIFQKVPEPKVSKNRVHLDIHVEPARKADEVARLTDLGAELISTHDDRGPLTYVMRDREATSSVH